LGIRAIGELRKLPGGDRVADIVQTTTARLVGSGPAFYIGEGNQALYDPNTGELIGDDIRQAVMRTRPELSTPCARTTMVGVRPGRLAADADLSHFEHVVRETCKRIEREVCPVTLLCSGGGPGRFHVHIDPPSDGHRRKCVKIMQAVNELYGATIFDIRERNARIRHRSPFTATARTWPAPTMRACWRSSPASPPTPGRSSPPGASLPANARTWTLCCATATPSTTGTQADPRSSAR
jgi:hypothetical protein